MKLDTLVIVLLVFFSCSNTKETKIEQLATGSNFTEGPAVNEKGDIFYADIPNELILVWTTENTLDTFRTNSNRANGLFFDNDQNLLVCESGPGRITSTSPQGEITVIADNYKGKRFNQPNDLWPDAKGGVYFTDPYYGNEDTIPQDGMHVYYILPSRDSVIRVCDDFVKPNGVIGTPDGKTLYVTDHVGYKTYRYTIQDDGTLTDKTLFADRGGDGMTLDAKGNLYLATLNEFSNVDVFSPDGELVNSIEVPEKPSNVCIAGKNKDELFVTARTSLYRIDLP